MPCAFLFGMLASRIGARTAVFGGLAVYVLITILGYFMTTATHFFALAILVGMVQGGTQALSRSLFASMIPRHKSSQFFAFFGVFERYAGSRSGHLRLVVSRSGSGRAAILASRLFVVAARSRASTWKEGGDGPRRGGEFDGYVALSSCSSRSRKTPAQGRANAELMCATRRIPSETLARDGRRASDRPAHRQARRGRLIPFAARRRLSRVLGKNAR